MACAHRLGLRHVSARAGAVPPAPSTRVHGDAVNGRARVHPAPHTLVEGLFSGKTKASAFVLREVTLRGEAPPRGQPASVPAVSISRAGAGS